MSAFSSFLAKHGLKMLFVPIFGLVILHLIPRALDIDAHRRGAEIAVKNMCMNNPVRCSEYRAVYKSGVVR